MRTSSETDSGPHGVFRRQVPPAFSDWTGLGVDESTSSSDSASRLCPTQRRRTVSTPRYSAANDHVRRLSQALVPRRPFGRIKVGDPCGQHATVCPGSHFLAVRYMSTFRISFNLS